MTMAGKSEHFTKEDFYIAGRSMNINRAKVTEILNQVTDAVSRWLAHAEDAQVPAQRAEEIRSMFLI